MQTTSRTTATASTRSLTITCRYCKGAHFSARCPNKPVDLPLELPPSEDDLRPTACPTTSTLSPSQTASAKLTKVVQNTSELRNTVTVTKSSETTKNAGGTQSQDKPYSRRKFVISCRYCKGPHFSARCPNKPSDLPLEVPPPEDDPVADPPVPAPAAAVKSTKSLKSSLRDKSKHSVKNFKHKARMGGVGKAGMTLILSHT